MILRQMEKKKRKLIDYNSDKGIKVSKYKEVKAKIEIMKNK